MIKLTGSQKRSFWLPGERSERQLSALFGVTFIEGVRTTVPCQTLCDMR